VAVRGSQFAAVDRFQLPDDIQCGRLKRRFAFKGMQDDPFEQVAQGQVSVLGVAY
jgi:hypothetical protein